MLFRSERWLGPAPKRPFNQNRFHFNFRWFWDYAGGLMTDWGVHLIDYALLGMGASTPKSVMAIGGKFAYPDGAHETPDTLTTVYEFDGYSMIWEQAQSISNGNYGRDHGISGVDRPAQSVAVAHQCAVPMGGFAAEGPDPARQQLGLHRFPAVLKVLLAASLW